MDNSFKLNPVFCQFCGNKKLSRLVEESGFKCDECKRITYLNSKPSVGAVIVRDENVLLIRGPASQPLLWDVPGGFLLYGEPPEIGLKRELREELSVDVEVEGLLAALVDIYGGHSEYSLNLFYKARLISDAIKVGSEILDYGWFSLKRLPDLKYKSSYDVLFNLSKYLRRSS